MEDFFKKRFAGSLFPPCQESGKFLIRQFKTCFSLVSDKINFDWLNLVYDLNADYNTCQDLGTKVSFFQNFREKVWKQPISY